MPTSHTPGTLADQAHDQVTGHEKDRHAATLLGAHRKIAPIRTRTHDGETLVRQRMNVAECPDCGRELRTGPHPALGAQDPSWGSDPNLYWCQTTDHEPLAACDVLVEWNQIATTQRGRLVAYDYEPVYDRT